MNYSIIEKLIYFRKLIKKVKPAYWSIQYTQRDLFLALILVILIIIETCQISQKIEILRQMR